MTSIPPAPGSTTITNSGGARKMSNLRHLVANARNFLYTCQGVSQKYTFFSRAVYRTFYRAPYHGTKIRCPCKMASETKTQFMQPKEKMAGVKPHTRTMAICNVARPIVPLLTADPTLDTEDKRSTNRKRSRNGTPSQGAERRIMYALVLSSILSLVHTIGIRFGA